MRFKTFLIIILLFQVIGCSSLKSQEEIPTLNNDDYLFSGDLKASYAYQLYKSQYEDETAKIRYLINLTRFSETTFVRNKEVFSGANAARWLEFKLYKFPKEAKTAKDFVKNLASYSKKSGKKYHIIFEGNRKAYAGNIYHNELTRLEKYHAEEQKKEAIKKAAEEKVRKEAEEKAKQLALKEKEKLASKISDATELAVPVEPVKQKDLLAAPSQSIAAEKNIPKQPA